MSKDGAKAAELQANSASTRALDEAGAMYRRSAEQGSTTGPTALPSSDGKPADAVVEEPPAPK